MGEKRDRAGIGREQEPRVLTLTEIRCRVERIAEGLSEAMSESTEASGVVRLEPKRFIEAMSAYITMN